MKYEDLDADTQALIGSMCHNTGKTKEQAILALVEFGMISMIAAVSEADKQKKIMEMIFTTVKSDVKLKKTAEAYQAYWTLGV